MIVQPACFKYLFQAPPDETSSYTVNKCVLYGNDLLASESCYLYEPYVYTTAYSPAFLYNYQCSATVITTFTPILIMTHTLIALRMLYKIIAVPLFGSSSVSLVAFPSLSLNYQSKFTNPVDKKSSR